MAYENVILLVIQVISNQIFESSRTMTGYENVILLAIQVICTITSYENVILLVIQVICNRIIRKKP